MNLARTEPSVVEASGRGRSVKQCVLTSRALQSFLDQVSRRIRISIINYGKVPICSSRVVWLTCRKRGWRTKC
eukprot:6426620-Prymnesium_polylepis.1